MLNHHTVTTLRALKLAGMAIAFEEQQSQSALQSLSFEERFGLLVDRECTYRDNITLGALAQACPPQAWQRVSGRHRSPRRARTG